MKDSIQGIRETHDAARRLKAQGVPSIAVCFFHAYANPAHELRTAELIHEVFPEAFVSLSHAVSGEWREYERTSTRVLNAYIMPRVGRYLAALEDGLRERHYAGTVNIVQSTSGMTPSAVAHQTPVRSLQSGPAGGVIGAAAMGALLGYRNVIGADVGGTTFDVSLVIGGGLGDPLQRDAALVALDVKNELLSIAAARVAYGVRLDPATLAVDEAGTAQERASRRAATLDDQSSSRASLAAR